MVNLIKSIFEKEQIPGWESTVHGMKYHFICRTQWDDDEVWHWCLTNLGSNTNWMVTMNGVLIRNEDDAVLFALAWC